MSERIEEKTEKMQPEKTAGQERKTRGAERSLLVLDALCAVSGVFFVGVYLPYILWHLPKGHPADVTVSLLVFAFVLLPFAFRKFLAKILKRAYLPLKCVWCFAMVFYMISFSVFSLAITLHDDAPFAESDRQTVVIVFGCQVHEDGALSRELLSRLDAAAKVINEHPDAVCVLSGGKGDDEPTSEAQAMKTYLTKEKNIKESRLLLEERSSDTDENLRFSLETLKDAGYDAGDCSFICVSSNFHTPRIRLLFSRMGLGDCATVSAPTPNLYNRYVYTVREYMSYVSLFLFG